MNIKKHNHLFITYDGLLDPLGKSQIIPYLKLISNKQRKINVVSFEKIENLQKRKINSMSEHLLKYNIIWNYNKFSNNFGKIGKVYDLFKMFFSSLIIIKKKNVQIIHTRSHIPGIVGYFLKKIMYKKLIFDFRGLWVELRPPFNS